MPDTVQLKLSVGLANASALILSWSVLSLKSRKSKPVSHTISIVTLILPGLSLKLNQLKNKGREAIPFFYNTAISSLSFF